MRNHNFRGNMNSAPGSLFTSISAALRHKDPVVQADAARMLGELRRAGAVPDLCAYVSESRHCYKTAGMEALARIGDDAAVTTLQALVDAPNVQDDWYWFMHKSVRAAAAIALLRLNNEYGLYYLEDLEQNAKSLFYGWFAPALLRVPSHSPHVRSLQDRLTPERVVVKSEAPGADLRATDPSFVIAVVEALGEMNGPPAAEHLRRFLTWRSRYVRAQAALGLCRISTGEEDIARLSEMLRTAATDFERIRLTRILVEHDPGTDVDPLVHLARHATETFDRAAAVEAMGELGFESFAPATAQALEDEDPWVRQCAVEALEYIGGEAARERIRRALADTHIRVRLQAAKALLAKESAA